MLDSNLLELAASGRWTLVKEALSRVRSESVESFRQEAEFFDIRRQLDRGMLFHLLSAKNPSDDAELLLDVLCAGADPTRTKLKLHKLCLFTIQRKFDPLLLASTSGKVKCVEILLKFEPLLDVAWATKRRMRALRRAAAAGFPHVVEALAKADHGQPKVLAKYAADQDWAVVWNRLRGGPAVRCKEFRELWDGKSVYEWACFHGNTPLTREMEYRKRYILVELALRQKRNEDAVMNEESGLSEEAQSSPLQGRELGSGDAVADPKQRKQENEEPIPGAAFETIIPKTGEAAMNPRCSQASGRNRGCHAGIENFHDSDKDGFLGMSAFNDEDFEDVNLASGT